MDAIGQLVSVQPRPMDARPSARRYARSGAVAGAASALAFTAIHHVLISDIWYSLAPMMVAGALCGLCVGWMYRLLMEASSAGSWVTYNLLYVGLLALLGAASVLVYEPITTVAAVIAANEGPGELFDRAIPLTLAFIVVATMGVGRLYARRRLDYGAILLTCTVLTLLLGLNISVIGLVYVPSGSAYLIAELFGLILSINLVYVAVFIALERASLSSRNPPTASAADASPKIIAASEEGGYLDDNK